MNNIIQNTYRKNSILIFLKLKSLNANLQALNKAINDNLFSNKIMPADLAFVFNFSTTSKYNLYNRKENIITNIIDTNVSAIIVNHF